MRRTVFPLVVFMAAAMAGTTSDAPSQPPPQPTAPSTFDEDLQAIIDRAADLDPLNSLLIWHQDSLLVEEYYRGMRRSRRANLKSASKTILSALAGIALENGAIDSLDQPLAALLPEYFENAPPEKRAITFRHALTMRTGLETTSFRNYGTWVSSRDWVRFQVDQEFECRPGRCWSYSTGTSHMVGAVISHRTRTNLLQFARTRLFDQIGVVLPAWDRDPQGRYLGGNNMALRPLDLLRFGELYLKGGVLDGSRLISQEWIDQSWGRYGRSPWNGNHYGYMWWSRDLARERVYFAWGWGGQFLFVVPRLKLLVVTTASVTNRPPGVNHNRRVYDLMEEAIIPAIRRRRPSFGPPAR